MPRYGGGQEDFREQEARLQAMRERLAAIEAKEAAARGAMEDLGAAEERATVKRQTLNRAKREGAEITEREQAVASQEARAVDVDTASIERNRVARERRAAAARQEAINVQRAFRGAQDPLFGAASASGATSQYALRRDLGVGQVRAQRLQEAIAASFLRPGNAEGQVGAQTRVQAAQSALVRADIDLAEAKRRYASTVRRGEQAGAEAARADRDAAAAARRAANLELESAEGAAASAAQLAAARREAAVAASREATASVVSGAGTGLIPHPTQFQGGSYVPTRENVERGIQPGLQATRAARSLELQREAAALGLSTNAEKAYVNALSSEERILLANASAAATVSGENIAARSVRNAGALRQEGVALSSVSQAMHKHGALTSEFILAAARGETTLKELGNQALITAGKFGGWTAAASGLFAAAGAIKEIGHGAIAASGGVHTLQRVLDPKSFTPDEAQSAFADLAREFNVPIETAIDSVYRMGQRFHEFPQAVEAARASLYSFKTGEVDVATSTENLLAIVNGFGLSSKDLSAVYDQINQAQNTFGIRIGDTEAGLAKAAGTYRNAGGDLNYLLGLTVAIGRATNRSGQEIGTGIARGVNEIRKSVNQAKLEAQGVEVIPENFQKTLQNGLKAAQRPGADLQQIASGLFGNQYARLIAPVLRDQDTLNAALKDTSPEKSKGSAQQELGRVLKQADEQIKALGISLQALGAGLSRAGAFNLAGVMLHGLNDVLGLAVKLVDTFDKIPHPLREGLVIIGEIALVMKGLQRFGAGERFATGPLAFLANPDQQFAARAKSGLRGARDAARNEQETTQLRAYSATRAYETAQMEAVRELDRHNALMARSDVTLEEQVASSDRLAAANAQAERMERRYIEATAAASDTRLLAAAADAEYAELNGLTNKQIAARARAGLPVPREVDKPSSLGVENYRTPGGGLAGQPVGPTGAIVAMEREAAQVAAGRGRELSERARRAQVQMGAYWETYAGGLRNLGATGRVVDNAAGKVIRGSVAAGSAMSRAVTGLKGVGSGILGLASSLGPLDAILIGWFALDAIGNKLEEAQKNLDAAASAVQHEPRTATGLKKYQTMLEDRAKIQSETPSQVGKHALEDLNPINLFSDVTGIGGYQSPYERQQTQVQKPAQDELDNLALIKRIQASERARGRPQTQLTYDQLSTNIKRDQRDRAAGLISQQEFDRRMLLHSQESMSLYNANLPLVNKVRAVLADAQRETGGLDAYRKSLRGLDSKGLAGQVGAITTSMKDFGSSDDSLARLRIAYSAQVRLLSNKGDAESIQALSEARGAYLSAVQEAVKADLDTALASGGSEDRRQAAFRHAATTYRQNILGRARNSLTSARERLADARRNAARSGAEYDAGPRLNVLPTDAQNDLGVNSLGALPTVERGGDIDTLRQAALNDADTVKKLRRNVTKNRRELRAAIRAYAQVTRELRDSSFQDRSEGRDIQSALAQSQTNDPVEAAQIGVRYARAALADARRTYGTRGREYARALTNLNNAEKELGTTVSDYGEQLAAALDQLAVARAGNDPVAAARATQAAGRRQLGRSKNRLERVQALVAITQANDQIQQAVKEQEDARFNLLESQTTDPVQQAVIERRRTRAAISGTTGAARLNAQAEYNRAIQSERDARLSDREGDIDFEKEMGRITTQDAITRYEDLLKIRNLTKAQKREILSKIHQLKSDSEGEASGFDLDVGSIRMPTLYDVRKAWDPLREQARKTSRAVSAADIRSNVSHMYDARSQVSANVQVFVNDKNAAGEVYDAIDRALGTSVRAKLRSRGMRG